MTHSIATFSMMTLRITTLTMMTLSMTIFSITILIRLAFSIMPFSITTLSIATLSITIKKRDTQHEWHSASSIVTPNVKYTEFPVFIGMLSVVMLSVAAPLELIGAS
jgi:hypothetical protein